jgi:hypothetical protein
VSVIDERKALDHPVSLFEHALRLHLLTPDGPLPDGGHPLPCDGEHPNVPYAERRLALVALLKELVSNPRLSCSVPKSRSGL